ncbi:MAG: Fe-S cluster assembly protein SufD [Bacteroidota bacterium]
MNKEQAVQSYQEQFAAFEKTLNGSADSRFHQLRRDALERFTAQGFPTMRNEDWRYTNLNSLSGTAFVQNERPAADGDLRNAAEALAVNVPGAVTLLFVNGFFLPELSDLDNLPAGLAVQDLSAALKLDALSAGDSSTAASLASDNPFTALNTAFTQQGVVVTVSRGVIVEPPLQILFYSSEAGQPFVAHSRIIVRVGENAQCSIVEQYTGAADAVYFTNTVADIHVGENAILHHVKIQEESSSAFHVASAYTTIERSGVYENHYIGLGAALLRNNLHGVLAGQGAHCTMNGVFIPGGSQHMDHFTVIDHAVPNCTSHELYKGVLGDETRGVFTGKIIVRQDAQKTDAKQSNNNLLLSEQAQIDTRPQLEIYADDVRCTHGATVGQINDDQLFYLISRGIDRMQAGNILSYAFASDVVSRIPLAELREELDEHIHRRLEKSWSK